MAPYSHAIGGCLKSQPFVAMSYFRLAGKHPEFKEDCK